MLAMELYNTMRLTDANFIMYAMKAYQNPHCLDIDEFHEDLKKIKYIKRLLNRYKQTSVLKERLILNHIIVLYNVFGPEAATKILFFKLAPQFWPELKTFLVFLHYMPERITDVSDQDIYSSNIDLDINIVEALRQI